MQLYTIGFTKKSAERFFGLLRNSGTKRLVDVRLHATSQLAGFAKRNDLPYFAKQLAGIEYVHVPELAPTPTLLDQYRSSGNWAAYEIDFLALLAQRKVEDQLSPDLLNGGCLLCSEDQPHHCHRRLVAEYLGKRWRDVQVEHLV